MKYALFCGAVATALAIPAWADENSTAAGVRSDQARNSHAANDVLNATQLARIAVAYKDKDDAIDHVEHAKDRLDEIKDRSKDVRMVPIYAELTRYSLISPIVESRQGAGSRQGTQGAQNTQQTTQQQATQQPTTQPRSTTGTAERSANPDQPQPQQRPQQGNPQQPQTQANTQQPQSNQSRPATVQGVVGQATSVTLDLTAAEQHLEAAKDALDDSNFVQADVALKAIEDGVRVDVVTADMPLVRARQNLMLARAAAESQDAAQVRAALQEASQALAESQNSARGRTLGEVRSEIDQASRNNQAPDVEKIDGWWDKVANAASADASGANPQTR